MLEFSTEGDADGDGADGANVDADDVDIGADPGFMIFMVGLESDVE